MLHIAYPAATTRPVPPVERFSKSFSHAHYHITIQRALSLQRILVGKDRRKAAGVPKHHRLVGCEPALSDQI